MNVLRSQKSMLLLIILSMAIFIGCDKYEVVIEDLNQLDANEALVLLKDKNIDAQKKSLPLKKGQTYHIEVKQSDKDAALRLLVYNHLPKTNRATLKDVYPPGASGIIPSKSDEMARLLMAMQGEVEGMLKAVPGIVDAHVVFSFDLPMEFNKSSKKTASVIVIFRPELGSTEAPLSSLEVKELIAKTVGGLLAEDVTVVQKIIRPIDYLEGINKTPEKVVVQEPLAQKPRLPWYLISLTLLALLIAAYGVFRLYLQKRFHKNPIELDA